MKRKADIARLTVAAVLFISTAAITYGVATHISALDVRQNQLQGLVEQTDRRLGDSALEVQKLQQLVEQISGRLDNSAAEVQKLQQLVEQVSGRLDSSMAEVQKLQGHPHTKKVDLYLRPAVAIGVILEGGKGTRLVGSGVVVRSTVSEDDDDEFVNYILTACHVVKGEPALVVAVFDYDNGIRREYKAQVEVASDSTDLALVSCVTPVELHTARVTNATPALFQPVVVTGVRATSGLPISTSGCVVKNFCSEQEGEWYVNAPVIYGCSGGPAFDAVSGEVIGIVVRGFWMKGQFIEHVGIIVPAPTVRKFLAEALK